MIDCLPLTDRLWLLSITCALSITFVINVHHEFFLLSDYVFVKRLAPCFMLNSHYFAKVMAVVR